MAASCVSKCNPPRLDWVSIEGVGSRVGSGSGLELELTAVGHGPSLTYPAIVVSLLKVERGRDNLVWCDGGEMACRWLGRGRVTVANRLAVGEAVNGVDRELTGPFLGRMDGARVSRVFSDRSIELDS